MSKLLWHFFRFGETNKYDWEFSMFLSRRTWGLGLSTFIPKGSKCMKLQILNLEIVLDVNKKPRHKWGKQ